MLIYVHHISIPDILINQYNHIKDSQEIKKLIGLESNNGKYIKYSLRNDDISIVIS
jgi:hypothetical protein